MYVDEWEWDDGNIEELAHQGIYAGTVYQVADGRPRFRRNKRSRAATHMMIGPDFGGRIWVVCIVQLHGRPGIWRAIAGWPAGKAEQEWYRGR